MSSESNNPFANPLTCQICGEKYLATEGYIARHGHQKVKGENGAKGYITDGCEGSRGKPVENSRDLILTQVEYWEETASLRQKRLSAILNEEQPSAHVADYQYSLVQWAHYERDQWQYVYDEWVQTITDEQWNHNRNEVVHSKRSKATATGWDKRRDTVQTENDDDQGDDRQPDPPDIKQTAFLVEHGIKTAMFTLFASGRVMEALPVNDWWEAIDTHDDLSTLPPEIATQFAGAL